MLWKQDRKEKYLVITHILHKIIAKMIFAIILLNVEYEHDSMFLKGGNTEWEKYQH